MLHSTPVARIMAEEGEIIPVDDIAHSDQMLEEKPTELVGNCKAKSDRSSLITI